jgi:hypothetical protein
VGRNNNNTKKNGRKKKGAGNISNNSGVTHTSEIKTKTTALLEALYKHKSPSFATGQLFLVIAEVFNAGLTADVDLARALLGNSRLILQLR